jgi:hypothetical protein
MLSMKGIARTRFRITRQTDYASASARGSAALAAVFSFSIPD